MQTIFGIIFFFFCCLSALKKANRQCHVSLKASVNRTPACDFLSYSRQFQYALVFVFWFVDNLFFSSFRFASSHTHVYICMILLLFFFEDSDAYISILILIFFMTDMTQYIKRKRK